LVATNAQSKALGGFVAGGAARTIDCWSSHEHMAMAGTGFVCLTLFIIQGTILPGGTFRETMRSKLKDVFFVPVRGRGHSPGHSPTLCGHSPARARTHPAQAL
jgi:hypothetical protein